MKKKLFLSFTFTMLATFLFSQNFSKINVLVYTPEAKNFTRSESWISSSVKDKFEDNLRIYTDFNIVDSSNENKILELQKKSESFSYDEKTAIELGKLTSAQFSLFISITNAGSKYNLSYKLTNLTTGVQISNGVVNGKNTLDELYSSDGCAVDELTLKLCEQLKQPLSSDQKWILKHGDKNLSIEKQLEIRKQEEENFQKRMETLKKEIDALPYSTDLTAQTKRAQVEAEKALMQAKIESARRERERLLEEQKKQVLEKKRDAERSDIQKKSRDEMAKKVSQLASEARSQKLATSSILTQVRVIESKKYALCKIREARNSRMLELYESAKKEFGQKEKDIHNRPYRTGELSGGKPTAEAFAAREKELRSDRERIQKDLDISIKETRNSTEQQEEEILEEIKDDLKNLKKWRTVSSLSDDLKISIGEYDGNKKLWQGSFQLYSDGTFLYEYPFEIKYDSLVSASGVLSENYLDNVDIYSSLFLRGEPVLALEVEIKAEEISDVPSSYKIFIDDFKISAISSKKTILSDSIDTFFECESTPAYDISKNDIPENLVLRTEQEIIELKELEEKKQKEEEARNEKIQEIKDFWSEAFHRDINWEFDIGLKGQWFYKFLAEPVSSSLKTKDGKIVSDNLRNMTMGTAVDFKVYLSTNYYLSAGGELGGALESKSSMPIYLGGSVGLGRKFLENIFLAYLEGGIAHATYKFPLYYEESKNVFSTTDKFSPTSIYFSCGLGIAFFNLQYRVDYAFNSKKDPWRYGFIFGLRFYSEPNNDYE